MTDDETKATHVITLNTPGLQANFKIATDQDAEELAAEINAALKADGAWTCTDPDMGAVSVISKPQTAVYIVQVFDAKVYEKMASDARYAQQRQQSHDRFRSDIQ